MSRECGCCKLERQKEGKPPRVLQQLPPEVVRDAKVFKKVATPVYVCSNCDGDSLIDTAFTNHDKRDNK